MFRNRTLDRWHQAGLLDDAARARIQAWEQANARPLWLWALAGVGVFAVALGVVALVAANWAAIPGMVKLAGHLILDIALAIAVYRAWRLQWPRARECLAVLLFGFILSGLGLVGQVYQLGGTAWQLLLAWMAACTPFLLLVTRSRFAAIAWACGAIATYAFALDPLGILLRTDAWVALTWLPALALLALGLLRGLTPGGRQQGTAIGGIACAGLLAVGSLPEILLRLDAGLSNVAPGLDFGLAASLALLPLLALDRWRRGRWALGTAGLVAAAWLTWAATVWIWRVLSDGSSAGWGSAGGGDAAQLAVALVFIAFWASVSWMALHAGRRNLFTAAFVVVGLRVFLFYWEAFGSLLSTGLGLMAGGVICMALAAIGWQIVRRIPAPSPHPRTNRP